MEKTPHTLNQVIQFLHETNHRLDDLEKTRKELDSKFSDSRLNEEAFRQFKIEYYNIKRKQGLTKIAIGSTVILFGFLITCFNFHANESFNFAMYGLTSIGICIVFWGLYKIIG